MVPPVGIEYRHLDSVSNALLLRHRANPIVIVVVVVVVVVVF